MSGTLHFDAKDVARLILHAVDAPEHTPTWSALALEGARLRGVNLDDVPVMDWPLLADEAKEAGFQPPPALNFVHDQGIYVMSNGKPQLADDDPNRVIYADGFDPSKGAFEDWWEGARDIVGGDDFVEPLPLDDGVIALARDILDMEAPPPFFIEVTPETLVFGFTVEVRE